MITPGLAAPWGPHDEISERAAVFFARRRFGKWGAADQAELDAWLAESTSHYVAWLRVEGIAARTDHLASVHAFKVGQESDQTAPSPNGKFNYRRFVLPILAEASIALFAAFGIPLLRYLMQPPERIFATNVGGQALLKFTDGTRIELNTDTSVRYRMTTQERTVWLDKGEAYFSVAHNAANPFTVVARGHRITDLGTEFLVRDDASGLDVVLVKGRAQLASVNAGVPVAMLVPGDEAMASRVATTITKKSKQELADELAWRQGILVFRNTPLAEVVREFNRYNATKLVIADPSIAGEKIVANVKTDDYESFLQLAEAVLKLRVDREGSVILLSRDAPEKVKRTMHVKRVQ